MTIPSRRDIGSSVLWGMLLATLVLTAGVVVILLRTDPDRALLALTATALLAASAGLFLSARASHARASALHDPLTGLPHRTLLEDRVEQEIRRTERTGEPFAVVVVDLDGFKSVNDLHGHGAGDAALRTLARRLQDALRTMDTVARVGGDEFVVVSPGAGDEEAAVLADRLRRVLRSPIPVGGSSVELDASIGWAIHPVDGASCVELLERADTQMYSRKHSPSAGVTFLERRVDPTVIRDVELALERSELVVLYQPVLELRSGAPHSAEALVRRLCPNRTLAPPSDFVPHVERTALVRDLTLLVVEDALAARRLWQATGNDLSVRVNIPVRLLDDRVFVDALAAILRSQEMPLGRLTLEVSPASVGAGSSLDPEPLGRLARLGVRLSLDDGGRAGSLAALRAVPFQELKIDATLVHGIERSAVDAAVVHGLIEIGRALRIPVVAEGVETRETWRQLASWNCELAQGFFVAEPRSAEELAAWLGRRWPAVA